MPPHGSCPFPAWGSRAECADSRCSSGLRRCRVSVPARVMTSVWQRLIQGLKAINRFRLWLWETPPFYELRGRSFQLKERLTGYPALHQAFLRRTGYELDLVRPRTFHHKITSLKIRRPPRIFVQAVDKVWAKNLALEWASQHGFDLGVARTLAVVKDVDQIPWDALPERFLIKASHRSGANHFVDQREGVDRAALRLKCRQWLDYPYGVYKHEWAYWSVPRRLLIEELIEPDGDAELFDYKFHMSRGKCLMIQVNQGLRSGDRKRTMLLPPWQPQPVCWLYPRPDQIPAEPENLGVMLEIASAFSREFPYLRVDLYSVKQAAPSLSDQQQNSLRVFFGEFTFFPGSGSEPVDPFGFDLAMGERLVL